MPPEVEGLPAATTAPAPAPELTGVEAEYARIAGLDQQSFEKAVERFLPPAGARQSAENQTTPPDGGAPVITPPSTPSDDAAATDGSEEEAGPSLDEELTLLASSYGLEREELDGFTNVEDARQAMRILDRQQAQAGREYLSQFGQTAADETFQQQPLQPVNPPPPAPTSPSDSAAMAAALRDLGEDNPIAGLLRTMSQQLEQQQQQLSTWQKQQQQQFQQQQQAEQQRVLKESIESLQELNPERYGKPGVRATRFQEWNIQQAIQEIDVRVAGMYSRGMPIPSRRLLAQRADDGLFSIENEKQRRRAVHAAESRNGARLGQPSAAKRKDSTEGEYTGPIEQHPELLALWNHYEQQS